MARLASTKAGYMRLIGMQVAHEGMAGAVWAPAPLESQRFAERPRLPGKADDRECVWAAMSDGRFWYMIVDLRSGETVWAEPTEDRCNGPVLDQGPQMLPGMAA